MQQERPECKIAERTVRGMRSVTRIRKPLAAEETVRIPGEGEKDSGVNAKTIPG
jgi:hypothetical protein